MDFLKKLPSGRLAIGLALLSCLATNNIAHADAVKSDSEKPDIKINRPLIPVNKDFKLANGLRVVLSEDHSVPVVSVAIVYDVGARDEVKKRSGFAHLFEHMMFQGSENVGKMDHFKYIESAGGSLNEIGRAHV